MNIGRLASLAAGLPASVGGMTVDRQCSSGMYAIALAANLILNDGYSVAVGGGLDQVSLVQNEHANFYRFGDPNVKAHSPHAYMPMIDTAEVVAKRFGISREKQDEYALISQQRCAAAQKAGALAGKVCGAGGGGCLFCLCEPDRHAASADAPEAYWGAHAVEYDEFIVRVVPRYAEMLTRLIVFMLGWNTCGMTSGCGDGGDRGAMMAPVRLEGQPSGGSQQFSFRRPPPAHTVPHGVSRTGRGRGITTKITKATKTYGRSIDGVRSTPAGRLRRPIERPLRSSSFLRCSCETVSSV